MKVLFPVFGPSLTAYVKRLINIGQDLKIQGEDEKSLTCFLQAVKLDPENTMALFMAGWMSHALEYREEAREFFERCLESTHQEEVKEKVLRILEVMDLTDDA